MPEREIQVSVDQLVDIAVAMPRIGVLDLAALHSLLHIIVRKLNLENCIVELPTESNQIKKILQSRSPIAMNEYTSGKLVQRDHGQGDKSVIKIKHTKKKAADKNEHAVVSNILDDILDDIFMPKGDISRMSKSIVSNIVDDVVGGGRGGRRGGGKGAIIGNRSSVKVVQSLMGDMITSVIGEAVTEREPQKSATRRRKTKKGVDCESGTEAYSESESSLSHEKKSKTKAKHKSKSKGGSDSSASDSCDENDPIVRTSQIGPMVSQILEEKSKPKKKSKQNDLFHQFEQLIKNLDTTDGSEKRVEFKDFLQKLFDELKTKTENYLQQIKDDREMMEQPTAKDLCSHVETQVSKTLIDSFLKAEGDSDDSMWDEDEERVKLSNLKKGFFGSGMMSNRFCGGEHTVRQTAERQGQGPKANIKEKYIDMVANQMKTNLRHAQPVRKTKPRRCCKQQGCTCNKANTLSVVYGMSMINQI